MLRSLVLFLLVSLVFACQPATDAPVGADAGATQGSEEAGATVLARAPTTVAYPAAAGFDAAGSSRKAIQLADSIVKYHGGYEAYQNTRYFSWNFFGVRDLIWDKLGKRARIDSPADSTSYILDYSNPARLTGRVRVGATEITDTTALNELLQRAHSILINDSYWLVQQFKLKDSGVTLTYGGKTGPDPQAKRPGHILDLTFTDVGDTPQNRYRLYVDGATYRINTWQFFRDAADTEPAMETPWNGYKVVAGMLLSTDRGGRFQLSNVNAGNGVSESSFREW